MKKLTTTLIVIMIACGIRAAEPIKSAAAEQLMQLLSDINGNKTLSGTMACVNWNISEARIWW